MAASRVVILDTSILCVWLKIPGMESCGPQRDPWDYRRVDAEITTAIESGFTLVLPIATIIETGNHIAQAKTYRLERAQALAELMRKAADQESPWAAFTDQSQLWTPAKLRALADEWPLLAQEKLAIGDVTIKQVGEYYAQMGYEVRLLTGDLRLSAFQPPAPPLIPRRRKL